MEPAEAYEGNADMLAGGTREGAEGGGGGMGRRKKTGRRKMVMMMTIQQGAGCDGSEKDRGRTGERAARSGAGRGGDGGGAAEDAVKEAGVGGWTVGVEVWQERVEHGDVLGWCVRC